MRLESIRLKNFKSFKDVEFSNLPEFCVLVGANGTGKSTLFSVFDFLKNALTYDLGEALARLGGRRGFDDVRSRESEGAIEIELKFRFQDDAPQATYFLSFDKKENIPVILREMLSVGTLTVWNLEEGTGTVIKTRMRVGERVGEKEKRLSLKSPDTLALKVLMLQSDYPIAAEFGEFIKKNHISDFNIQRHRLEENNEIFSEHLSREGNNLALVAENLYTKHPDVFQSILERLKIWVPGINRIESKISEGGRILLRFQDGAFKDPFTPQNISDGTLGAFAYLVLLHDPAPHPLLCVEEPENQLYPTLLEELGGEFRYYAHRSGGQVMVSTHSPDFLNACRLDEVFWLEKKDGYTQALRAADNPQVAAYMRNGDLDDAEKMGYLWSEGFFGKAHPR